MDSRPVEKRMLQKIQSGFEPLHVELVNESSQHAVPPGSETHFRLVLVSKNFEGKSRVERHRTIHAALAEELQGSVHALTLALYSPGEWEKAPKTSSSPPCLGGSE